MTDIPQAALRARQRYINGDPVQDIRAESGFCHERFYDWLDGAPQPDGTTLLPPIPRRRKVMRKPDLAETRAALIAHIMHASDLQIRGVEQRLGIENTKPDDRESDAHMLAVIAKTLRELMVRDTPNPPDKNQPSLRGLKMISSPETSTNSGASLRDELICYGNEGLLEELLATLNTRCLEFTADDWPTWAHEHQKFPLAGNNGDPWTTWLILGGRGAGKTRAGAEWVRDVALNDPRTRIALIGETEHDAREVMVEGVSGLLAVHRYDERPEWIPSRRRLQWRGGAVAEVFSAEDPESLRGPQFSAAWCDELAKWRQAEATFDMLQFGLRLGERPRQVITTTPRPIALLKRLIADPATALTHAGTQVNARHLAPAFLDHVLTRYGGTKLGRQEIDGEIVEERNDALWTRAQLEACRVAERPALARIVVAIDPPASARKGADACGIVAAGCTDNGTIYVLADESAGGLSPQAWATKAIALWRRLEADSLVAEVNFGGDMVKAVMREADANVPVVTVRATRAKYVRAAPVAQLYEQGRVKHAGVFPALENEMCDFGFDGLSSGRSPDRLDALVWAVTALTFGARTGPRVRGL